MKKITAYILMLISICSIALAFTGCDENETETGIFYTVTEAYEKGFITRDDVMSIAYYHNGGTEFNEAVMGENYTPQPLIPEELNAETDKAIKTSFYNSERWEFYEKYFTYEDIAYSYFGTYDNAVAVKLVVKGEGVDDAVYEEVNDNVTIYYRNGLRIFIFLREL